MRTLGSRALEMDAHAASPRRRKGAKKHRVSADAVPANDTRPPRTGRARRVVRVELVSVAQGAQTVVGVRSLSTSRVLFACVSVDARGAELAMLAAERYCAERGYVVVMPAAERTRAA